MKKYIFLFLLITSSVFAGSMSIELENDVLFKSDKNYTHGTRISYQEDQYIYSIGQNMYTPSDISTPTPITNERPYAGTLYFAAGLISENYEIELALGAAGKYSHAEETQKQIHQWLDSEEPMGWDYQMDDKFLFQINTRVYKDVFSKNYLNARLYTSTELGNIFCNLGIGANIIAGYNVPKVFNKPIISKGSDYSFYVFTDIYDRYVFINETLESDYTDIEKEDVVLDIRYGLGMKYKSFELIYSTCNRSKEYKEQTDNAEFGSVMIRFNYKFPNKF